MEDLYQSLYSEYRWWIPKRFNIAEACCLRWSSAGTGNNRIAVYAANHPSQETWTYAKLAQHTHRLSNGLRRMGIQRGDRVAVILPQCPEAIAVHMAVYQLGAITVPISPKLAPDALEYRLRDSESRFAFIDKTVAGIMGRVLNRCALLRQVISINHDQDYAISWNTLLERQQPYFEAVTTSPYDPATLIYTAGVTGAPKAVLLAHAALIGHLPAFVASQNWFPQPNDIFFSPCDWSSVEGLFHTVFPTLYFGHPIVTSPEKPNSTDIFQTLERFKVTNASFTPSILAQMMRDVPHPRQRYILKLRAIMVTGESLSRHVYRWAQDNLHITPNEIYGTTEASAVIGNSSDKWPSKPGSMGRAIPGHHVALLDTEGNVVDAGKIGEICINKKDEYDHIDPIMFLSYWRKDEATQAQFSGDWFRTGELARMDSEGYYWYIGRADEIIYLSHKALGPTEIEHVLLQYPKVRHAAVTLTQLSSNKVGATAYIISHRSSVTKELFAQALQTHVHQSLPELDLDLTIEFVKDLPLTPSGKAQRRILKMREKEKSEQPQQPQLD